MRRFGGLARRPYRERDQIVDVSREQLTQLLRCQVMLAQRCLHIVDEEAKRFSVGL